MAAYCNQRNGFNFSEIVDQNLNILIEMIVIRTGRQQPKTLILSTNVDQKSLETVFSIAMCRPTGDKWQSKTLFLAFFYPRSSIVKGVLDCRLPGVVMPHSN